MIIVAFIFLLISIRIMPFLSLYYCYYIISNDYYYKEDFFTVNYCYVSPFLFIGFGSEFVRAGGRGRGGSPRCFRSASTSFLFLSSVCFALPFVRGRGCQVVFQQGAARVGDSSAARECQCLSSEGGPSEEGRAGTRVREGE